MLLESSFSFLSRKTSANRKDSDFNSGGSEEGGNGGGEGGGESGGDDGEGGEFAYFFTLFLEGTH